MKTFSNPIIPGFYPDPSICRVGDDYYLVTSTFEYFPGIPIFHSKDLVHWRQLGHVLDRPSQLSLDGFDPSAGIYAPTIRYHNGVFYVATTLVDKRGDYIYKREKYKDRGGNFIVTAADPAGPWSEPYWLKESPGIDPSLFFDDNGKVYFSGKRIPPSGERFEGHREVWLQELDLNKMELIGERFSLWDGCGGVQTEGAHIYKINGWYYLIVAEGGTGYYHAVTIARSQSIIGPYYSNPCNPILTHRHLGRNHPIVNVGHGDLVETQNGEWWMVVLASRPNGGYYSNLGRETFMAPVSWEEEWPVVSPGTGKIEAIYPMPDLPEHHWPSEKTCDHFNGEELLKGWNFLRTPTEKFWSLSERPSYLRLKLLPQTITHPTSSSFIGRRQQHINFTAKTFMEFEPQNEKECAGMVLLHNNDFQYRFVSTSRKGKNIICLIKRHNGFDETISSAELQSGHVYLKVEALGQEYSFYYALKSENWILLAENMDGRILSTEVACSFTGTYIGLYASSNGIDSSNFSDFDWFEYRDVSVHLLGK